MLFKLSSDYTKIEPLGFHDFSHDGKLEKQLEDLLAEHLFDSLFEGKPLLPFHQERAHQAEADIYALDAKGDVIIFELKRSTAASGAVAQLLRYAEEAGGWSYATLARKFKAYSQNEFGDLDLRSAHQQAFRLSQPLAEEQFNRTQHMLVIGSAADRELTRAIDFWKGKGLPIDFLPYRIYKLNGELFFEFFAKPYDEHVNPSKTKGVLFDTNRTYNKDSFQLMVEGRRIAAYGDRKNAVESLQRGDIVFYSHRGEGLVAAAKVTGHLLKKEPNEWYWDVDFLTPIPTNFTNLKAMPFSQVEQKTNKTFYWARIQKVPYLSNEEAQRLLVDLQAFLGS